MAELRPPVPLQREHGQADEFQELEIAMTVAGLTLPLPRVPLRHQHPRDRERRPIGF